MFVGKTKARRAAGCAVAAGVLVAGLSACSSTTDAASAGSTLTIAAAATNPSLDPVTALSAWPFAIYSEVAYDALIQQGSDGNYGPDLATKFGYVGKGNTTFSLTLRTGVKFSDGSTLTAAGIKAWLAYGAKAAGPYQGVYQNIASADVTGPLTLTLHMHKPDPNLEYNLSQSQGGFPISADALKDPKSLQSGTYGAGPYMLDKSATVLGTKFTYIQNPNYWNKASQYWQRVVITVVPNENAALSAVESGQALLTGGISPQLAGSVRNATVTAKPTYFDGLCILDRGGKVASALRDPRVRQALNYAVDRTAITTSLFEKYGQPSVQGLVPGIDSYDPSLNSAYTYDPAKAKQLLAEAGYPHGFSLPIAVIPFGGQESALAQAIAGYLTKVGIQAPLTVYPSVSAGFAAVAVNQVAAVAETTWFTQDVDIIARAQLLPGQSVVNPFTETPETSFVDLYNTAEAASGTGRRTALQQLQSYIIKNGLYLHTSVSDVIYVGAKSLAPLQVTDQVPIVNFANIAPPK